MAVRLQQRGRRQRAAAESGDFNFGQMFHDTLPASTYDVEKYPLLLQPNCVPASAAPIGAGL
jgi:hypothetical protein